jgi:hypothetical protein
MPIYVTHPGACWFSIIVQNSQSFLCTVHLWASHQNSYCKYDERLHSVQSGSKHRWHAVKMFYLFKLLSKFIHTLTIYLTTTSVAKAIASSDGVISKQCQMGCDAIWCYKCTRGKLHDGDHSCRIFAKLTEKKILHVYECRMKRSRLHTLEHTDPVSLKKCGPRFDLP